MAPKALRSLCLALTASAFSLLAQTASAAVWVIHMTGPAARPFDLEIYYDPALGELHSFDGAEEIVSTASANPIIRAALTIDGRKYAVDTSRQSLLGTYPFPYYGDEGPVLIVSNSTNRVGWGIYVYGVAPPSFTQIFESDVLRVDATVLTVGRDSPGPVNLPIRHMSISTAPEPATWALMMLGFGATGSAFRYRAKTVAAKG